MSLAEYYSTNYSKCNLTYSFLASWQGLAYPSHILQVFSLPVQILTFYIIWKKTPINMKMMKWPLLINHAWCCWFDFLVCTLATPYIFYHNLAFLGVGVFGWLKVSNTFQVVVGFESAILAAGCYLYVFETRSSSLHMNRFRIQKTWARILYHVVINLVGSCFLLIFLYIPKDQEAAKLDSLRIWPCPTVEFFRNDVLVALTDPLQIRLLRLAYGPALVSNALLHWLFHIFCTVYYLYIAPVRTISIETRKSQQRFFVAIVLQTLIPSLILGTLLLAVLIDEITLSLTQERMNFIMILFAFHGLVESLAVLLVHRPYREAVWKMIMRKPKGVTDVHRDKTIGNMNGSN